MVQNSRRELSLHKVLRIILVALRAIDYDDGPEEAQKMLPSTD